MSAVTPPVHNKLSSRQHLKKVTGVTITPWNPHLARQENFQIPFTGTGRALFTDITRLQT